MSLPAPDFLASALLQKMSLSRGASLPSVESEQRGWLQKPRKSHQRHCAMRTQQASTQRSKLRETPLISTFPAQQSFTPGRASSPQDCSHTPDPGDDRAGPHITHLSAAFMAVPPRGTGQRPWSRAKSRYSKEQDALPLSKAQSESRGTFLPTNV